MTPLRLSDYYLDLENDALTFTATSHNPAVASVSAPDAQSMITITAVAEGSTQITVTAADATLLALGAAIPQTFAVTVSAVPVEPPDNNQPRQTDDIPDLMGLMFGGSQDVDLSMYFTDDDGDAITYTAMSSDTSVATASVAGAMVTVMVVDSGMARIDITATDPYNRSVRASFNVEVINQAPMVVDTEPTKFGPVMAGDTVNIELSRYFSDPEGNMLTYTAMSDDDSIAMASMPTASGMTTITAMAEGAAMITITANDGTNDDVSHTLTVTVDPAPEMPNNAPTLTDMAAPMVDLVLEDDPSETLDVSMYFMDADGDTLTYEAMSSDTGKATESVSVSMVTITAVAAGSATITVTASDGNGGSAMLEISVTVTAPDNMAPRMKAGMMLPDLLIELADDDDDATTQDTSAAGTADNQSIDLSMYFEDPDGIQLFFKVETDDDSVIKLHSVAANPDANPATPASGDAPDGTDDEDTMLIIVPQAAGTATVTVTVYDIFKKSYVDTFMVTVTAEDSNTGPSDATGATAIPNQVGDAGTDPERLKIGVPRTIIDGDDFDEHFQDPNFNSGDVLTISVEYYPATTDEAAAEAGTGKLDADDPEKVGVTASLSATTWGGDPNAEFTLTLTGRMGTPVAGIVVALIATDTYDERHARVFTVRVNNRPKAEGAQASATSPTTVLTLADASDELRFKDMGLADGADTDNETIDLVDANGGYFHDPDGDTLVCRINGTSGEGATFALDPATSIVTVSPAKLGPASVTLACVDTFNEHSPSATLNVNVTHRDISRQ